MPSPRVIISALYRLADPINLQCLGSALGLRIGNLSQASGHLVYNVDHHRHNHAEGQDVEYTEEEWLPFISLPKTT
jgi:hypothetical protein